ncbi:lactonase family protein [Vibrio tapetis subsp. quintayensis]|uniref:lactonase family protein n=1 Tax=Vibrio tapetis TaxID=52443 RepID=UPI0025B2D9EB|nr:lactonase family protein [Vibrio tapetis]MDN3681322.1 lactonase family protein [Vibrio tapetis subsp. quintayensis]
MNRLPVLVGCYTDNNTSQGLYRFQLNVITGEMTDLTLYVEATNPSFTCSTSHGCYLSSEVQASDSPSLRFVPHSESDIPVPKNQRPNAVISGNHPCHITISPDQRLAITSQYSSGSFNIFTLHQSGHVEASVVTLQHHGSGPNKERQTQAHAHQAVFLKHSHQFATVDLGSDEICLYQYSESQPFDKTSVICTHKINAPAGSGPRHLVFSHNEDYCYVVCELSETVLVLEREINVAQEVSWKVIQQVDILPEEEKGEAAAAIKLSPDGQFIYVSGRHQSKISWFSIDAQTRTLTYVDSIPTHGHFPRDFSITPDGQWLIAANQHSNNIISYARDLESGKLNATGFELKIDAPVCVAL